MVRQKQPKTLGFGLFFTHFKSFCAYFIVCSNKNRKILLEQNGVFMLLPKNARKCRKRLCSNKSSNKIKNFRAGETVIFIVVDYCFTFANAFYNNNSITAITITKNIIVVGDKAFYDCDKLKKITITNVKLKRHIENFSVFESVIFHYAFK